MRLRGATASVLAAAVLVSGCGTGAASGPRDALRAFLVDLASGDVAGACRTLTPAAAADLHRGFGGATCERTITTASEYVSRRSGESLAVRDATILPAVDVPLSPAPYRTGSATASLRVAYDDPVLGQRQEFDVELREIDGAWQIAGGIAALFTLL